MMKGGKLSLTPQQKAFRRFYLDINSETFGNATQSGVRAGFSYDYANQMLARKTAWVLAIVSELKQKELVEKNLKEFMEFSNEDANKLKIKADITKFVAKATMREKYGDALKLSDADGGSLNLSAIFTKTQDKDIIDADFEEVERKDLGLLD